MLTQSVAGWKGYELAGGGADPLLLALTPRLLASRLHDAFDAIGEAALRSGLAVKSTG